MKQLIAFVNIGELLHSINYIDENGKMENLLNIPIDNIPESLAYYANKKNVVNINLYTSKVYGEKIKQNILDKSIKEYRNGNLKIEIKEY